MKRFETFELTFTAPSPQSDRVAVPLEVSFTCAGKTVTVPGFYAGDGTYKVRFLPEKAGTYHWQARGLIADTGDVLCEDAARHGPVRADGLHFRYADGTRYTPFGTTVYAMVHQPKDVVDTTMATLRSAPFNKVRLCVFPKHFPYNYNEPALFPFEKVDGKFAVTRPCFAFWEMLEGRLRELDAAGIEADLILFHPYDHWGFAKLTKEECFTYLDYLTRRLAAFPNVWWSLANEYDTIPAFEWDRWMELAKFVREHDPYGHLLSNHHCLVPWDYSDPYTTHLCLQDSHFARIPALQRRFGKPVIFDEVGYEGDIPFPWGSLTAFELVDRFWRACSLGGYCTHGETYEDEAEQLWWSKGGVLKGESAPRIAFLRSLLNALPGDITVQNPAFDREAIAAELADPEKAAGILPVFRRVLELDAAAYLSLLDNAQDYAGQCGSEAFLWYYSHLRPAAAEIALPETAAYDVFVVNAWEMTRTKVQSGARGKIRVALPGKEGIAILAVKGAAG